MGGDVTHIVISLVALAAGVGILTMLVRDPQGANTLIMAPANFVAGATKALEGRAA